MSYTRTAATAPVDNRTPSEIFNDLEIALKDMDHFSGLAERIAIIYGKQNDKTTKRIVADVLRDDLLKNVDSWREGVRDIVTRDPNVMKIIDAAGLKVVLK